MVAMLTTAACILFFRDLDILSNLLSIATLFIFMLVAIT
jgi:APA family basic amino acid/polyamine antiporter